MLGRQRGSWMETQLGYLNISLAECMKVAACVQLLPGTSEATIGRGGLQRESLSYKCVMCTSTKRGRVSVAGIMSIGLDLDGLQRKKRPMQKKIKFLFLLSVVEVTKALLACHLRGALNTLYVKQTVTMVTTVVRHSLNFHLKLCQN